MPENVTTEYPRVGIRPTLRTTYRGPVVRFRVRWDRILGGIAVGLAVAAMAWWAVVIATSDRPELGQSLPPCATEDAVGCYWDADTMGNGRGHDVVSLPGTEE